MNSIVIQMFYFGGWVITHTAIRIWLERLGINSDRDPNRRLKMMGDTRTGILMLG